MCGKLFNYLNGQPLCPNCMKELDKKFEVVKEYLYDNPNASIQQVSEENEVSIAQLKKWIREERLCFSENSMVGIECENCGVMIRTGRFCNECKDKLANSLNSAYKKEEPQTVKDPRERARMRFLD